jgi:hypothetical protein
MKGFSLLRHFVRLDKGNFLVCNPGKVMHEANLKGANTQKVARLDCLSSGGL